ncbi:MAG: hypothetical protein Rubg2KO_04750 [Rubricoccaceae bacterium]
MLRTSGPLMLGIEAGAAGWYRLVRRAANEAGRQATVQHGGTAHQRYELLADPRAILAVHRLAYLLGVVLVLAAVAAAPARAQAGAPGEPSLSEPSAFTVPRLSGPVVLDGHVDAAAWNAIAPLPLVKHWPESESGAAPSESTEIRVAYDDDYASCRCYAPSEAVFAASFKRDLRTRSTDSFALTLDTYGDNENGVYFLVSPTGSRTDVAVARDATESTSPSASIRATTPLRVGVAPPRTGKSIPVRTIPPSESTSRAESRVFQSRRPSSRRVHFRAPAGS